MSCLATYVMEISSSNRAAQVRCAESQLRAEEVQYDARRVESLALHSPSSPRSLRLDELNVSVTADAIHAEVEPLRREKQLLLERIRELQVSQVTMLVFSNNKIR